MTKKSFQDHVIAQDDDGDYEESGYVAVVIDGHAYLSRYGHCSCYTTFTSLTGGGISDSNEEGDIHWDWAGTVPELLDMAKRIADPVMPQRQALTDDCDYDHLAEVYRQVLQWHERQAKP